MVGAVVTQAAKNMTTNVWLSWSSGKDSSYTLFQLLQNQEYTVTGLLTTVNEEFQRVAMHAVRRALLRAQAEAVGIPLHEIKLPYPCPNGAYEERMSAAIATAKASGVRAMAFGDLFLADIRAYREQKMQGTGIEPIFPLWLRPTAELAQQLISSGFRAVLTCVDPKQLDRSFIGRQFDQALLDDLPEGVDPCGENGEFHTFVYEGPIFKYPLRIKLGEVVERDGFVFQDVLFADDSDALLSTNVKN